MLTLNLERVPDDYEEISVTAAAKGLSSGKLIRSAGVLKGLAARAALISVEAADVRFRLDAPATQVTGHFVESGETILLGGSQTLKKFSVIREAEGNATLRVSYFY